MLVSGVRSVARAAARTMYARWRRLPLQDVVLFEAFEGASTGGDPGVIAEHILATTDLPVVWALAQPIDSDDPRLRVVRYRSAAYFKALATSRYLVNNVTFPALFDKRDDQVYLNTWHGTPLKRMGADVDAPWSQMANTVANLQRADILLSSSPYMTETMYAHAYGIDTGAVLELGTPRVDVQFTGGDKDLVLYAPTWQENSYTDARDDTNELVARMAQMPAGTLLRVHNKLAAVAAADPRLAGCLAPADVSTNALLARTRLLVTDYSSVAFDALATGTQVVFYTPTPYPRGVYLRDDELPGPRTDSLTELDEWIRHGPPPAPVAADVARERFCPHEDGKAAVRAAQRLLAH